MSSAADNAATVRAAYDGMASGDPSAFLGALHPEVELHEPPSLPYGGSYTGQEEIIGFFQQAAGVLDASSLEIDYVVAEGDRVVSSIRIGLQDGGEAHMTEHWLFEDGKAKELRVFWFDSSAAAA